MPYQSVYAPHYSHYQQQTNRPAAAPQAAKPKKKQVSFGGATIIMYREPQQYQAQPSQSKRKEAAPPAPSKREPVRYETLSRRPKHVVYEGRAEHVEHETAKAPSAVERPRGAFLPDLVSSYPMMVYQGAPTQHVKRSGNSASKYTLSVATHRQRSDTISERTYKDARGTAREAQEESGVQIALRDLGSQKDII